MIATIGAGDSQSREENESFGLRFGTMQDRVDALRAAVMAAHDTGARLWVGGHAKAVRQVAAAHAHGWNAWGGDVDYFASQVEETRAMGAKPDFDCTWGGLVVLAEDDARAQAKADRLGASDRVIVGGPATVAAALASYGAVGADWVIVAPLDSRDPGNARLLADQVMPLLGD
jgi:alkanesulfonate monooxygenase SsuD/methylene tetrahydromethanopterin reductase-like flavin-dependent oxidoreductase (luciferase family)